MALSIHHMTSTVKLSSNFDSPFEGAGPVGPVQRDQGVELDQQHPGGRVEPQEGGGRRLHRDGGRHRGIPLVNQAR